MTCTEGGGGDRWQTLFHVVFRVGSGKRTVCLSQNLVLGNQVCQDNLINNSICKDRKGQTLRANRDLI